MSINTENLTMLSEYDNLKKSIIEFQNVIVIVNEHINKTIKDFCSKVSKHQIGDHVKVRIGTKKEYNDGILVDISINFETAKWIYKVQLITKDKKISKRVFTNITDIKYSDDNNLQNNCMVRSSNEKFA